ncbi:MAG TPA: hypothetical protein ACFYD0_15675 [Candidatus Wunengus sp. YC65]|uniref:hypothetical protein n=1 Tax=Candidatus Wunengus sp. YC65 TaxID=3367701 RepID=UPI0040296D2F
MRHTMKLLIVFIILFFSPSFAFTKDPDCTGADRYPTSMAFGYLKDAGITDNYKLDFSKTKTVRLASEKIGKDLYRQIHHITFVEKSGNTIEVITVNDVSNEECSMSGTDVFVVNRHMGDYR